MNSNYCVSCGQEIPEGDMICLSCKKISDSDEKVITRKHKGGKNFVMKKWNGNSWDKPDIGDVIRIFGTDFEVVSNEPGNVQLKRKIA